MDKKLLEKLEYPKIINKLESFAATSVGKAFAAAAVPSGELEEVRHRLAGTDEAAAVDRMKGAAPFGGIVDIRASLKRSAIGGTLSAFELLGVADTVLGGRRVKRHIEAYQEKHDAPILGALAEGILELRPLEEAIRRCIDENGVVVDTASDELYRIRRELRGGEARVREKLESMIRSSSTQKMLQEALITVRNDRFVIPVKSEYRSSFGGIVHDQSSSGATMFIEPEQVVQMNNKLRELRIAEEREIEKILQKLTAAVAEETEPLGVNVDLLGQLDFLFAKARLAREMKASLPAMNDRGYLRIRRGRHPLLPMEDAVPLDVELGGSYTAIIVTGPNTGGKTVSLKTIGLLSLMAMTGLFVPAEDGSELCVFDAVFADIGDEQSIEQNLSTFSSHMTNIISILKKMTPRSLVLLDEVGAGTDPAEGSALAIAILEHIRAMGCRLVATTHYSELKAYAYDRPGVINASMEFDVETLRPTYRLLVGVPGRSNAFAIAERLGLSKRVIEDARVQVTEEDQRVESMIAKLEEHRLAAEAERREAERLRRESEELRRELTEEKRRLAEQRDKLMAEAEREAVEALSKARREAETIIADLRRQALEEGASIKEHKLIEAKRRLEEAAPKPRKPSAAATGGGRAKAQVAAGDEVKVVSLGQRGHVVERHGNEAVVQLGIIKMKVALTDLEPVGASAPAKGAAQRSVATVKRTRDENVRTELDLRGSNVEEAIVEVDRFLDEAIMANLSQVYIIHGKGTGVLRTGIQEYLRRHKHVRTFRIGAFNEGGHGVTVAELK
ncbi:endonuclease MutS2 [Paenibacillus sp.]|uniref:endonuclease MutS2 n=1 Tax=Paenibacillus sp. TaxID=58172 RepID=UPI002D6FA6A6|nr:endonuclease MutS2 [Paenibacillus sp.]HZG55302.1 endonuclease MutS2 [Paenibacillus sp.]